MEYIVVNGLHHLRATTELDRGQSTSRAVRVSKQIFNRNAQTDDSYRIWVGLKLNSEYITDYQ